ncbi:MAG TPA: glutathione S-transferase family protein [Solirubrobacteraceae bacterium]|jgi:glutathione S-transferase|nr:glutathione S-transferase family protein [Solirubrobacteraceae bacterium]
MARTRPNILVTIPISHYCEKARWALDRSGVPYVEHAHLQFVHRFAARRAGGGTTVPVFVSPEGALTESADILDYADAHSPADRRIYPDDPAAVAEIRGLEREFDDRLGPHGRRWMYHLLRRRSDLASRYGTAGVPTFERVMLPVVYPAVYAWIDRHLEITQDTSDQSIDEVRAVFDEVGARLSDGRSHLCGDGFTAADLTFSALAAAVIMPPGYGVELPPPDELPPAAAEVVHELRAHPAGRHALAMFRDERPLGRKSA